MATVRKMIAGYEPCVEAVGWLGSRRSPERAWTECERADWLLWIAAKAGVDRGILVLAACDCAETVLHLTKDKQGRPGIAISLTRRWASGDESVSIAQVAGAAVVAAGDYTDYAAAYATHAATAAAAAAAYTAPSAATAADYAAYAAAYGGDGGFRHIQHLRMCKLVRDRITCQMVLDAMEAGNANH